MSAALFKIYGQLKKTYLINDIYQDLENIYL